MPPRKRKYMDSVRNGNAPYKRSKPTAKDRRDRARGIVRVTTRGPIAQKTITKLKYNTSFASSATVLDYVFNLNSIFDPDHTSTGHQPYGHDTYQTLYNRYRVYKCDYILHVGSSGSSNDVYRVIVGADNSQSSRTNANLAAESPNFRTFFIRNNAGNCIDIKGSYYLPRLNGSTTKQYMSDDRFQAQFGTSPNEQLCLHVLTAVAGANDPPGASTLLMNITLIYHVEMFDPNELAQS